MHKTTAALLAVLIAASLAGLAVGGYAGHLAKSKRGEYIVAVTFPNMKGDVSMLVNGCPVQVIPLAPPGVDPHAYTLDPGKSRIALESMLVVSTGHAPFEISLRQVLPREKLVEVNRIPGIRLAHMPDSNSVNPHMPILDPRNYRVFIEFTAEKLAQALPECSSTIHNNMKLLLLRVDKLIGEYTGILDGREAVLSNPPLQYTVEWLGVRPAVVLSPGEGVRPPAEALSRARRILESGGLAVVMVTPRGEPYSRVDEWLLNTAGSIGAPVLKVPAPFLEDSVFEEIMAVASSARSITLTNGLDGAPPI